MKKAILLLVLFALCTSCSNDDANLTSVVINESETLSNTAQFIYDLGGFGDEEGARITTQATNFATSELERNFTSGSVVYTYQPLEGFVGSDFVEIFAERGSDGAGPSTDITIVRISFTVTE